MPRRAAASALSDSDLLRRLTQPELLYRPLYLSGGHPRSFRTPGPQPRTDAAMWLKRYSGLLRLHAALLSPAEGFLFPVFLSSSPSPQLLSSAALCLRAAPRAADTVYILHYRHRYPVHGTGYASLFLNPCASVYTQLGQAAVRLPAFHCTSPLSKLS